MRHLVLEDLDDDAPRVLEDERARDLECATRADPTTEHAGDVDQRERRLDQFAAEERAVVMAPLGDELAQERAFELRGQRARAVGLHAIDVVAIAVRVKP
jgi:hypothetical protein